MMLAVVLLLAVGPALLPTASACDICVDVQPHYYPFELCAYASGPYFAAAYCVQPDELTHLTDVTTPGG